MTVETTSIRPARTGDEEVLAGIHLEAWRGTYRGILGGVDLERLIARRGCNWWQAAIRYGTRISVIEVAGTVAGYVTCGRSRMKTLPFEGEIYELYLLPEYQGLGFGRRLFREAQRTLAACGHVGTAVRVLVENDGARRFYERMGGKPISASLERFGNSDIAIEVYGWPGTGQGAGSAASRDIGS